ALQLQDDIASLAGLPEQGEARRLSPGCGQRRIPQAAAASLGEHEPGTCAGQVDEELTVDRGDRRAVRHGKHDLVPMRTGSVAAHARSAVSSTSVRAAMVVEQGGHIRVDDEYHVAAVTPVTPVRTSQGLELLPMHRHAAMTA